VTLSPAAVSTEEQGRHEPPFPCAIVEEMLKLLVKAIRAHQLYLHNNPTYLRALEQARASFAPVWEHTDELVLEVTDTELRWEGVAILHDPEKASDSLSWILYKDGLRELRLRRDFEQHELIPLLDIVQRVRKASPEEDDLLTLLWEQEFAHLRYRYIDISSELAAPLERAGDSRPRLIDSVPSDTPTIDATAPGLVNPEEFDSTLYFLDEREIEYLQEEVRKEYASDLRGNVVSMLLDVYEQQKDVEVRDEICGLLDGLMLHFLSAGHFRSVAHMLREDALAAGRAIELSPEQRARLLALASRLSEPEVLAQLLQSLDEASELPGQEDLNALFDQLSVSSLGTVFAWLNRLQTPRLRMLLENAASRLALANTNELVRLIGSSDRDVSLEAVRRAGAVRATAAVSALAKIIGVADAAVRLAAVHALGEIASPGALQLLERTIDDADRDVRVATTRALAARAYRPALPKLEGLIKGRVARDADLTERMALFEAFGTLCGDAGVSLLDGLLNSRGLFGQRGDVEIRACAAMALGRVASPSAIASLQRASGEKEVLVRNAVSRALRGGQA
jgi:hypothetical protein